MGKRGDSVYVYGRLVSGLDVLTRHPGRIRERLIAAFDGGLAAVRERDFPMPDMAERWRGIHARVAGTGTPASPGALEAAINALPEDAASAVAADLADLRSTMTRWFDATDPERVRL